MSEWKVTFEPLAESGCGGVFFGILILLICGVLVAKCSNSGEVARRESVEKATAYSANQEYTHAPTYAQSQVTIPTIVTLNDLKVLDQKGHYYTGKSPVSDAYGTSFNGDWSRYCMDWYFTKSTTVDHVLNCQYSTFNADYFVDKYDAQLCIYADGVKVFDSGVFDKTRGATPISISVQNVRVLRIEASVQCETSIFGDVDTCNVYLANMRIK